MHCASLGYDTAHLAHLRSALAERGAALQAAKKRGQRPGNPNCQARQGCFKGQCEAVCCQYATDYR